MEVTVPANVEAKLTRIAHERGPHPQTLAREAIGRLADCDDWFVREVEKGVAQVERATP